MKKLPLRYQIMYSIWIVWLISLGIYGRMHADKSFTWVLVIASVILSIVFIFHSLKIGALQK